MENWCWWLLFWLDIKSTMLENISEQKIISWEWINACTTRISFSKSAVVPTLPIYVHTLVQGDPNQSLLFQMARTLKICISDLMMVKTKCVLEASIYFWKLKTNSWKMKINGGLQNTFWLYQHGVRNAYFQSYSHLK